MHLKAAKQFPRLSAADKVACEAEETAYRATPCPSTSKGGSIPTPFYYYLAVAAMETSTRSIFELLSVGGFQRIYWRLMGCLEEEEEEDIYEDTHYLHTIYMTNRD
jgi:hypothetical protein